jgi:LmbE family N-acetylglucosaminyl deacetylase
MPRAAARRAGEAMAPDTTGELGDVLCIWAHPDDEAYLSAGLMMRAIDTGRRAVCVTATKGEAGFPDDDPRSLAERSRIREAELAACLAILGVTEHRWLGYADGGCAGVDDKEAAQAIAAIVDEVRPDTVLTFGPDGGTGHSDHIAICRWTTAAMTRAGHQARLLYATKTVQWSDRFFNNTDPSRVMMVEGLQPERVDESDVDIHFACDERLLARKVAALRAQASQVEPFLQGFGLEHYTALVREEFFRTPVPTDPEFIERARTLGH